MTDTKFFVLDDKLFDLDFDDFNLSYFGGVDDGPSLHVDVDVDLQPGTY